MAEKKEFSERLLQRLGVLRDEFHGLIGDLTPAHKPATVEDVLQKVNHVQMQIANLQHVAQQEMEDFMILLFVVVVLVGVLILACAALHGKMRVLFYRISVLQIEPEAQSVSSSSS
jgi:hypothetical protein